MLAYIILALIVFILLLLVVLYNQIIRLKTLVNEAFSGIDVQCKRRSDLIPNLVAVVKQYGVHEKEIFENVAKMRSVALSATDLDQRSKAEAGLTGALKTLFAVAENYPTLKANENFLALQKDLTHIEEELNLARRYYNGTARNYNMKISTLPTNIIANFFNFKPVTYFELSSSEERNAPKVTF